MRSSIEEILEALEGAGLRPIPLDSNLSEPLEPGAYWRASVEKGLGRHGLLRFELLLVEHTLEDALALAEETEEALERLAPSLTAELRVVGYGIGERVSATLLYRRFF